MTTKTEQIVLPAMNLQRIEFKVVGDSPIICHTWSEKAKKEMLGKQMHKAKTAKEAKDPWADYCDSLYWLSPKPETPTEADIAQAKFWFPAVAFKSAAISASRYVDGMKMTSNRGAFHIIGDMVEIEGHPQMREDMVRIGMGTADIRYRGEFREWSCTIRIRFNASVISQEQIVNLFNLAGFGVGVGEWRPEKDGSFGMFHVE